MRCPCRLIPVMQPGRHKVNTSQLSVDLSTLRKSKKHHFKSVRREEMTTRKMTHRCGFKPPNLRPGPALPFPDRCQRKQGRRKPKRSALRSAEGSATGTGGKRGRSGKWAIIYKKSRKKQMKVRRGDQGKSSKIREGHSQIPKI